MTIKELLVPRFRLIESYPGNSSEVGSVSIEESTASYFRRFPTNFKELGWWEEREESEMPDYVKWDDKDSRPAPFVRKIKSHFMHTRNQFVSEDGGNYVYSPFLPATEEEYLNQ